MVECCKDRPVTEANRLQSACRSFMYCTPPGVCVYRLLLLAQVNGLQDLGKVVIIIILCCGSCTYFICNC